LDEIALKYVGWGYNVEEKEPPPIENPKEE
jgi:hypothetical protein